MRKRTRRKVWNPAFNPIRSAVFAASFKGDVLPMEVQEFITLGELKDGKLDDQVLHIIRCVCGISRRLAQAGIGSEVAEICDRVTGCLDAAECSQTVTPDLVSAVSELYEYHRAQRELAGPVRYSIAAAPYCKLTH